MSHYRQSNPSIDLSSDLCADGVLSPAQVAQLQARFFKTWGHLIGAIEWDGLTFHAYQFTETERLGLIGALVQAGYIEVADGR